MAKNEEKYSFLENIRDADGRAPGWFFLLFGDLLLSRSS
jgi:hypothetical protein